MSKNTTTPKFKVGDRVLIFADSEGVYSAEQADTPLLREATIVFGFDEDGDYGIDCPTRQGKYATEARVFPLGTILVDGDPIRPKPQEQPEGHSLHSDGGMTFTADQIITGGTIDPSKIFVTDASKVYVAEPGTPPPAGAGGLGDPASGWTPIGYIDPDNLFPERHYEWRDCGCKRVCEHLAGKSYTTTFELIEMDPEAMALYYGRNDGGNQYDPYKEFLDEAAEVLGDRGEDYGGVEDNFRDIAAMWSVITGAEIRAEQVGLMMIALKLVRANKTNKRDNLLDIVGYAAHVAKIQEDSVDEA